MRTRLPKGLTSIAPPLLGLLTFNLFGTADVQAQICKPAPAGLVSWWPLDETSGTQAADIIDGNPGTHIDGPTPTPGVVAGGLSFDGVDDYVRIPDAANLNPGTGDFTVDFWMKTSSQPTGGVGDNILSKRPICNVASFWDIRLGGATGTDGRLRVELFEEGGANSNFNASTIKVNDGQWRHIAVVREGPMSRLYIDGALDISSTGGTTNISNDADILVGNGPCVGVDGTTFFDGELDEIEYFNVALTADQVQAIYDAGSAGKCKPGPGTGPVISSVNNDFSSAGALSPGTHANLVGQNLSASPEECFSNDDPLPTTISPCNAMVLVNGEPAPVSYESNQFIEFQIPFDEPTGKGLPSTIEIVVDVGGARSAPVMVDLQRFAPAIGGTFIRWEVGGRAVTEENRPEPGEQLLANATGLGPTEPPVPTGFWGAGEPVVAQVKVLIHGAAKAVTEAEVLNADVNGLPGRYRVFFRLPEDLPTPIDPNYFYGVELVIEDGGDVFTSPRVNLPVALGEHQITGVLDAAGFQALISPGSIVSVFGNFVEITATARSIPLGTNLNGFSVTFNDIPGALFGVFDGPFDQSNVQVPWNLDVSSGKVEVKVHWKDDTSEVWSDPFEVDAALASPGIYMFPPGTTQAIVTNFKQAGDDVIAGSWAQAPSSIDPVVGQPAAIGGVVTLWCDGLGPVSPQPPTGDIPPAGTVPVTDKIVRVFVGGVEAQVLGSAVLQPTSVGLNQINIFIPQGVTPGDAVPIVIEVDCGDGKVFRSREDVTIAVRAAP